MPYVLSLITLWVVWLTYLNTRRILHMATVTKADLDAAVAQAQSDEQSLEAVITTAITDIKAAVAGNQPDFTDTLANLTALDNALKGAAASTAAQDPGATPAQG